jgi:predicted PurR-regulated permease PerM
LGGKKKKFFNAEIYLFHMISQYYYFEYYLIPIVIGGVIGMVINVLVASYIANDARKRGMDSSIYLILVCCCCGWLCGIIIYLLAASDHPIQTGESQQPSFNSQQQTTYGQQPRQPVQPTQPKPDYPDASTTMPNINIIFCSICGSQNPKNAKYCSHCGANLN